MNFLGTQKQVQINHGERAISVELLKFDCALLDEKNKTKNKILVGATCMMSCLAGGVNSSPDNTVKLQ